jgi:pimeloyl-ACP methyl ester carboxylesterase
MTTSVSDQLLPALDGSLHAADVVPNVLLLTLFAFSLTMMPIPRPSWFWYFTEGIRTTFQLIRCMMFMWFHKYKNQGDGHPVIVVPGFLGSDLSTTLLRKFLTKSGYRAYGWELGRNLGNLDDLPKLAQRIESVYQEHQRPVTVIGWSLGGIYVRECARLNTALIRQIITLGSPFAALDAPNHARWIFDLIHKGEAIDQDWINKVKQPVPVRTACLYSKQDGIVPWQACMETVADTLHENIRVKSSHFGFVANRSVFRILEKRLPLQ